MVSLILVTPSLMPIMLTLMRIIVSLMAMMAALMAVQGVSEAFSAKKGYSGKVEINNCPIACAVLGIQ